MNPKRGGGVPGLGMVGWGEGPSYAQLLADANIRRGAPAKSQSTDASFLGSGNLREP
jgi:hypothetical protein